MIDLIKDGVSLISGCGDYLGVSEDGPPDFHTKAGTH